MRMFQKFRCVFVCFRVFQYQLLIFSVRFCRGRGIPRVKTGDFQNWGQVLPPTSPSHVFGSAAAVGAMKAVLALILAVGFTLRCAAQSILAYKEKVSESRIIVQLDVNER